jgi:hydrocephalus-inducing protein
MVLVVDLEGVGQDMLAVPIKAECLVPKVKVNPSDYLEFDECFLNHPKTKRIEIINDDILKAKFEIMPQEDQSKRIAIYTSDLMSGVINPKSSQVLNISLKTEILNTIRIPLTIKVEGYHIPFMITILAHSTGPKVKGDKDELDFGAVQVLKDKTEKLTIKNNSKIPAEYTAFTKNKESIWKVIQRHGILKPDDEKEIDVICNADEVQKFQDTLHIIVNNGVDLEVALKAKGIGSTLFCKDDLEHIDFKTEYTQKNITKEFFLENRGRKAMKIQWQRQTKMERKNKKDPKGDAKKDGAKGENGAIVEAEHKEDENNKFVFFVVPDTITLNPKMGIMIQIRANSLNVGKITEQW